MITHLKDRKHYEDLYDKITVDIGRREAGSLLRAREEFLKKAKITDKEELNKMDFWWERLYWWLVGLPYLLPRWEEKDATISSWMSRDRAIDERLASARPRTEPTCSSCGKQGLRLVTRELLHREGATEQSVLFMFDCAACKKRTACWEDGSEWISPTMPCPKCTGPLDMDVKMRGRIMTTTFTCDQCGHKEVEKTELGKKDLPDPEFERHKEVFCLSEERARTMQAYRPKWEEAMRMMDDDMKRMANKELYDAAAKIERLKIPQLIELLRPAIEASGYIEVAFDKPELGGYVTISFSCMDSHSDREDTKSRKELKKVVTDTLIDSNWRLTSHGISYRLGYLTGSLRAYENEDELIQLLR
ncbi:MAG TPA: hypothetical protein VHT70_01915 [Candidatus Saccharimonadales bacterium]|jgi:predicted RNA-binding Zn-ribbon protein involved in translation (DUF1610 family)|nr:hypothetical protein [Candidatus Saccharimonadales bacterium]